MRCLSKAVSIIAILLLAFSTTYAQDTFKKPLTLKECARIALENSSKIAVAKRSLTTAQLEIKDAGAGYLPRLEASAGYQVNDNYSKIEWTQDHYDAKLSLKETFFDNGKTRAQIKKAKARLEAARIDFQKIRDNLIFEAAQNYYALLKAQKMLQVKVEGLGERVKKGDLLVELDTTNLKNRLSQANADLEAAKAKLSTLLAGERPQEIAKTRESLKQTEIRLTDTKTKLDRQNELFSQGFISRQDVDTAQREYELARSSYNTASQQLSLVLEGAREQDIASARASVLKAEVGYEQALQDLKEAKIYASISGVVMEKNVEEGELISSGMTNSGGGTLILVIADLSGMRILTKINEVDITKVKTGQDVEITLDAIRGEKYHGRVTDIASLGKTENNIVTYEVVVEILNRGQGSGVREEKLEVRS